MSGENVGKLIGNHALETAENRAGLDSTFVRSTRRPLAAGRLDVTRPTPTQGCADRSGAKQEAKLAQCARHGRGARRSADRRTALFTVATASHVVDPGLFFPDYMLHSECSQ